MPVLICLKVADFANFSADLNYPVKTNKTLILERVFQTGLSLEEKLITQNLIKTLAELKLCPLFKQPSFQTKLSKGIFSKILSKTYLNCFIMEK